jgi:hypothetical protein
LKIIAHYRIDKVKEAIIHGHLILLILGSDELFVGKDPF